MRLGKLSQEAIEIFQGLSRTPARRSDIEPTELLVEFVSLLISMRSSNTLDIDWGNRLDILCVHM